MFIWNKALQKVVRTLRMNHTNSRGKVYRPVILDKSFSIGATSLKTITARPNYQNKNLLDCLTRIDQPETHTHPLAALQTN